MCGIAGYVSMKGLDGPRMTESLHHRGPDFTGEYETQVGDRRVYLGSKRLSILDLSFAGAMPMFTEDRQVAIVYNGEVYNFKELKDRYLSNYTFKSKTDTEVILYLYDTFGIDFIEKLNGAFAIAIFDNRRSRLYLIRDRVGIKPLYYHFAGDNLVFGSEIKAILASGLSFSVEEAYVQRYFVFKYVPGNDTLFGNIKRLPPGHFLEYDIANHRLRKEAYWHLCPHPETAVLSYSESQKILLDLLEDATKIRLIADVPVGNFLSGGLDSSTIACILRDKPQITHYCAKKTRQDLKKEGTTSDFDFADRLAREMRLNLMPIDIGSGVVTADVLRQILRYSDDLIADGSQIPAYLITEQARATSRVMLTGMGADELLLGYSGHLLTLLSLFFDKMPALASSPLTRLFHSLNQGKGLFKAYRRWLHKFGKYYHYPGYKYGLFSIVGDYENSLSIYEHDPNNVTDYIARYFQDGADPFACLLHFETDNFLVKNLHYIDRMCMANSVEGRMPFLDHRIVEFAAGLPRSYKLSNLGRYKRILKDGTKGLVPGYIIKRRKAGFGMPLRSILSDRDRVDHLLDRSFFGDHSSFSLADIDRIIHNHISGKEDNSSIIFALISYQEWHKMYA